VNRDIYVITNVILFQCFLSVVKKVYAIMMTRPTLKIKRKQIARQKRDVILRLMHKKILFTKCPQGGAIEHYHIFSIAISVFTLDNLIMCISPV